MLILLMFGLFIVLLVVLLWDTFGLGLVIGVWCCWLWVFLVDGVGSGIWVVEFGRVDRKGLLVVCRLWLLTGSEGGLSWGRVWDSLSRELSSSS
jgi:hypothetical protein